MLGLDNLAATGTTAVAVTMLLQALKNSPLFPWITRETQRLNFAVGVLVAGLSAAGIHFAWDPHSGSALITINTHLLWAWFLQWAGQQTAYKGLVVPAETLGEIRAILRDLLAAAQGPQKGSPQ